MRERQSLLLAMLRRLKLTYLMDRSRVFLALALFNLERYDEAEETYKKAIEVAPSQPLARQVSTSEKSRSPR